jgi:hypothetical protein
VLYWALETYLQFDIIQLWCENMTAHMITRFFGPETALGGLVRGFHHQFYSFPFELPSTIACSPDIGVPSCQSLGSSQKGK